MIENFDVDKFLIIMSHKNKQIETKDISKWLECSCRYVQLWAKENIVNTQVINRHKCPLWDKYSLTKFAKDYNDNQIKQKHKKENKKRPIDYYIPRKKIKSKKDNCSKKIAAEPKKVYITTKDIFNEFWYNHDYFEYKEKIKHNKDSMERETKKSFMKQIQLYCKKHEIPKSHIYEIDIELKSKVIEDIKEKIDDIYDRDRGVRYSNRYMDLYK